MPPSLVPVEVEAQVELRYVVEDGEGEAGEHQAHQEEEPHHGLVDVTGLHVPHRVPGDVVPQPDGRDRDEHKVSGVQQRPVEGRGS